MGLDMRPVVEKWGSHSSIFVSTPETVIDVFNCLSKRASDTEVETYEDSRLLEIMIYHAEEFFDLVDKADICLMTTDVMAYLKEEGVEEEESDVRCLLQNIQGYGEEWRRFWHENEKEETYFCIKVDLV